MNINHTWVGDMDITLESPAGTVVTIFNQGCSGDDLIFVFDDEGVGDLANCNTGANPAYPEPSYVPSNPLSAFDGESTLGDWILSVTDTAGGDDGTLNSWGIEWSYDISVLPLDVVLDANGTITIPASSLVNSFDDNCGSANVTITGGPGGTTDLTFSCDDLGENEVIITATDASGNEVSCTATVNIIDNTPPVLVCDDVTIGVGPTGVTEIDPMALLANSPSTYDVVTISSDNQSGAPGNTDLTVPVTMAETVSFDWDYTTPDGPAFDSFGYLLNGVYTELTDPGGANDQSGNSGPINVAPGDVFGFRSASVDGEFGAATTTVSNFVPGFNGQFDPANWTVNLDNSDGDAFFVEIPGGPLSFDACGITILAVDITEVTCDDVGTTITITVFASDSSLNIAVCQSMVTVVDELAPEVTCPEDQTVDPGVGNLFWEVEDYWDLGLATATDNCTDPLVDFSQDPAPGTLLSDGVYTVTLCSTDEYGNEGCCTFELTVESILGANDNELNTAISMYPNPASDYVILANGSNILLDRAAIYDVNGKLVNTIDLQNMGSEMTIDVSQLSSGVYIVQISGENSTTVKRLIKL